MRNLAFRDRQRILPPKLRRELGHSLLALGLGAAVMISCNDLVDASGGAGPENAGAVGGTLAAEFEDDGVRLENGTGQKVYYLLYDPEVLALYARCVAPTCPGIEPGATTVVPFHLIPGSHGSALDEVVIEYWNLAEDGADGWRVEDLRTLTLSR